MPLMLENFFKEDPQNSLKEHHTRGAYRKISTLLTAAHTALVRIRYDDNEQERVLRWFGQFTIANKQQVFNNIRAIHNVVVNRNITFRNGGAACAVGDYAYVRLNTGLVKVYLCDQFFRAGRRGIDSTVGTIIHELSHLMAHTQDHAYGQIRCRGLATTQEAQARTNADNYQYYCESFG